MESQGLNPLRAVYCISRSAGIRSLPRRRGTCLRVLGYVSRWLQTLYSAGASFASAFESEDDLVCKAWEHVEHRASVFVAKDTNEESGGEMRSSKIAALRNFPFTQRISTLV